MIFSFNIKKLSVLLIFLFSTFLVTFAGKAQTSSRPNILIITTDQQQANAMSYFMGKEWIKTPNLDKLATTGMVFTRAYAANPICVPSRNSMVTGLYPHQTGMEANSDLASWWSGSENTYWTGEHFKSFGTYFKEAGYETAYFGKWHLNYDPEDMAAHGFEIHHIFPKNINDISITYYINEFLDKSHKKPFLIWASFINPHDINQWSRFQKLPEGSIGKVPPVSQWPPLIDNLAPPKNETEAMQLIRKSYHKNKRLFPVGDYSKFDWRRLRWGYYRLIEKVDAQIGKVLSAFKKHGYTRNTLIVFTSDHGTGLGAHGFIQKTVFYEESARVPLILKYSGKISHGENQSLVNTGTDLLPTLLDFAHIRIPDKLPGKSLKESAEKGITLNRPYIVIENKLKQGNLVGGSVPVVNGRMVRGKRYKYCLYDTLKYREALFDLKNDPKETVNIAYKKSSRTIINKYRDYLKHFAKKYDDETALKMLKYVNDK